MIYLILQLQVVNYQVGKENLKLQLNPFLDP